MRIASLGAFPFPVAQGSQHFTAEQAWALAAAGARVTLVCYGSGDGRALPDLELVRAPRALSPRRLRAGPSPAKPVADLALAAALARAHARQGFDAVLAHNAEAMLVALAARPFVRARLVYVAHTLWRTELPSYAPPRLEHSLAALGARLDALCARRADAVLALSAAGAHALAGDARGPVEVVPPGARPGPPPAPAEVARACEAHGLPLHGFAVYAGNVDRYQDLHELDDAAARLPEIPCVVVTHDPRGARFSTLRVVRAATPEAARLLVHGARLAVLPRRSFGGFPIKLLGYMEAGRAIVARRGVADTLVHGESAWLLPTEADAPELADGIREVFGDDALRARLGTGARAVLEERHAWPDLAARTLALLGGLPGDRRG